MPLQASCGVQSRVGRLCSTETLRGSSCGKRSCCPAWLLTIPRLPQDLREKNWKAMEALASAERTFEEKLRSLTQAKVSPSLRRAS